MASQAQPSHGTRPMTSDDAPALRVHGPATPEGVAAVLAVLAAAGADTEQAPAHRPSTWASPAAVLRAPVLPGPGAWRESLRRQV